MRTPLNPVDSSAKQPMSLTPRRVRDEVRSALRPVDLIVWRAEISDANGGTAQINGSGSIFREGGSGLELSFFGTEGSIV